MKILRTIYLIIAAIILLPIEVILIIGGFLMHLICNIILKYKYNESVNCIVDSTRCLIEEIKWGLKMNKDFIQNGFTSSWTKIIESE